MLITSFLYRNISYTKYVYRTYHYFDLQVVDADSEDVPSEEEEYVLNKIKNMLF